MDANGKGFKFTIEKEKASASSHATARIEIQRLPPSKKCEQKWL